MRFHENFPPWRRNVVGVALRVTKRSWLRLTLIPSSLIFNFRAVRGVFLPPGKSKLVFSIHWSRLSDVNVWKGQIERKLIGFWRTRGHLITREIPCWRVERTSDGVYLVLWWMVVSWGDCGHLAVWNAAAVVQVGRQLVHRLSWKIFLFCTV